MMEDDDDDVTLDGVILQIFEEQADTLCFPLTTPKQARDFVRILNRKGFTYEMVAEEMGEKFTYFQNWRLGHDAPEINERVVRRLNRPLQAGLLLLLLLLLLRGCLGQGRGGFRI